MVKGSMGVAKVPVAEVVIQYKFSTAGDCRRELKHCWFLFCPTSVIVAKTIWKCVIYLHLRNFN